MQDGFILLHRKLLENAIFYKADYFQVWIYLLLRVNYRDNEIIWNNQKKTIKKGTGIFSQRKISQELGLSVGTINNVLKYLKSEHQIEIVSNNNCTEIKIVKWEEYQDIETILEHRLNATRTQGEHGVKQTIQANTANTIKTLREQAEVFLPDFGEEMIEEFLIHWEEKDREGTPRWKKQKTWETNLRLAKWKKNKDTNFGRKKIIPKGKLNPAKF